MKKMKASSVGVGDRISGLSDELLHHVMSFLPVPDAVRTCMLSPRWLHLWASMPSLDVEAMGFTSEERFINFVYNLLLHRGGAPLEKFWIRANGPGIFLDNFHHAANMWICDALRSNVQELGIVDRDQNKVSEEERKIFKEEEWPGILHPDRYSFTSSHLKRLHLCYVSIDNCLIKQLFSGCPALEDLEMINCLIYATEFSSTTLKNLSIDYVDFPEEFYEAHDDIVINMPGLVSLHIGEPLRKMLSLMDMQSLVTSSIYLDDSSFTFASSCQILGALSHVKNLQLLCPNLEGRKYLLGSEMRCNQVVFTNLTTLSLDDWCLHGGCKALLYILKYSPNLEKLTLKLNYNRADIDNPPEWLTNGAAEINLPYFETETSFDCKKLKKIEINCPQGDKRVGIIVVILCANTYYLPEINIKFRRHKFSRRRAVVLDSDSD